MGQGLRTGLGTKTLIFTESYFTKYSKKFVKNKIVYWIKNFFLKTS